MAPCSKFHTLSGGIKEGVAFEVGFAAEGTLSFVLNYVFLMSLGECVRSQSKVMPAGGVKAIAGANGRVLCLDGQELTCPFLACWSTEAESSLLKTWTPMVSTIVLVSAYQLSGRATVGLLVQWLQASFMCVPG